jgi:outer membrane protein assembly factor BamB
MIKRGLLGMGLAAGVVATAVLASAGCDTLGSPATPEVPLWVHHPGGALHVWMRRELTASSRDTGEPYERGKPTVDPAHRRVFVGSSDHGLYALRAEDAFTLWRFETMAPVQSEPLYDPEEDVVYFGSMDGALYKVQALDGDLLWRFSTNSEVSRPPVIDGDTLYFTNANDTLIALDRKSGEMKWHQHRTPAFGMEIAGHAGVALGDGLVYTAFSDGVVLAYSTADGSEQWPLIDLAAEAEAAQGELPPYLDVDTTPIVSRAKDEEVVFVGSYAAGVFALNAENGRTVWDNPDVKGVHEIVLWEQPPHPAHDRGELRERAPLVPGRRVLLASSGPTGLWGLDPDTGETIWRRDLPEGGMTAPVAVNGAVLVGTTRYGLFLFSVLDGGVIDGLNTGGDIAMTPAAFGSRAFVLTNAGWFLGVGVDRPPGTEG